VFDIEINETDPEKFVQIVKALEPTFGGINLEDIKAPECFYIEQKLKEELKIRSCTMTSMVPLSFRPPHY
jgi:malate dehydrogenase (oxaloacetate-decarboxylating)(NADP+)